MTGVNLSERSYEIDYEQHIRAIVRLVWAGQINYWDGRDLMRSQMQSMLPHAWELGFRDAGFKKDEIDEADWVSFYIQLETQLLYVLGFMEFVEANSKMQGGKLQTCLARARLYTKLFSDFRNRSRLLGMQDAKLMWVVGPTEHCIFFDTPVITQTGEKPIGLIGVGEYVLTRSGWRKVTEVHCHEHNGDLIEVQANGRTVTCTPEHRFFTQRGWVQAQDLGNDYCLDAGQTWWRVTSIPILTQDKSLVYNLTVDGLPEFFAAGMLVHNCPSCMKLNGKVKKASYWNASGVYPQRPMNPNLICHGFGQCRLVPTDAPLSKGPLPSLP